LSLRFDIATTNLTQNMDKVFERRFIYKIMFEKPTLAAKKSICRFTAHLKSKSAV
jgi:SpoVK/Ycf46/Vps4 family AAA+-type ATPase